MSKTYGKHNRIFVGDSQRNSQDSNLLVDAVYNVMEDPGAVKGLVQLEKITVLDM